MNNLNKNILRYANKNKFSLGGLFVLFSICMSSVTSLGLLSTNFAGTYNSVVLNGNQHNIVTNEMYLSSSDGQANRDELLKLLTSQEAKDAKLNVRRFEGLTIQSSPEAQSKVIRYEPEYPSQYDKNGTRIIPKLTSNTLPTDNLQIFLQSGLPYLEAEYAGKIQKFYHLPNSIDLPYIIDEVTRTYSKDLTGKVVDLSPEDKNILKARQTVLYFLAKGENTSAKYTKLLDTVYQNINNPNVLVNKVDPKSTTNSTVKAKFDQFFLPTDPKYNAPIITGSSINFQETNKILGIIDAPNVVRFEDYTSRICIVPPALLKYQNKEVYSFEEFVKTCSKNTTSSGGIYDHDTINLKDFDSYINSIPSKYKVQVDSVDYLIVGAGITPDFFYPIVSLENTVVNFSNEMTIYTNNNGFNRTQYSFQSAPLESLLLIKYSGQNINNMVEKINEMAKKYLAFPSGTINTYTADDESNIFSPTAARVLFIQKMVTVVNAITVLLSIFLTLITLFVVIIILNKFISENKKTLYVLVAQGISKYKAVSSIVLLPLIPCAVAALFSYLLSFFTQGSIFNLFSAYWPLETYTQSFNIFIMFGLFVGFYAIAALVSYLIGIHSLKSSVSSGMNVSPAKLGPLAIAVKKPLAKFNVVTKFRMSLAFGSFTKLLFLTIAVSLFTFTLSFIGSSYTSFNDSLATVAHTNTSTMYMNLTTPTRNGGQYYAATFEQSGQTFQDPTKPTTDPNNILNKPSFANSDSGYGLMYKDPVGNKVPLFKKWADLLYMSANDLSNQEQKLRFLGDVTNWEFIGNVKLGGVNPWETVAAPLLPSNQRNASNKYYRDLLVKLLADNRIIATNEQNGIAKNGFDKSQLEQLKSFYIVKNSYVDDYVKVGNSIFPIIKLDSSFDKVDLSSLTKQNIEKDILSTYGQVFENQTDIIDSLDKTNPEALKVNLIPTTNITVLTPRNVFTKLFNVSNKQGTMPVYDAILGQNKKCSPPNVGLTQLSTPFLNLTFYILETYDYRNVVYKNSYNIGVLSAGDEAYTYVDATVINPETGLPFKSFDSKYPYHNDFFITGIQKNSQFINLIDQNGNSINDKLFNYQTKNNNGKEDCFPVIPNLYAKKLYNLNVGDEIKIFAKNNVDRYNPKLINKLNGEVKNPLYEDYKNAYTRTFKVIDFSNSTKEIEFYTSMESAQKTIGLSFKDQYGNLFLEDNIYQENIQNTYQTFDQKYSLVNEFNNKFGGFNGVFSNDDLISVTNSLTLYSPSGLYPGAPEFSKESKTMRNLITNVLFPSSTINDDELNALGNALYYSNSEITDFKNKVQLVKDPAQKQEWVNYVIDQLTKIYRKTIFFAMIDKPGSIQALVSTFSNLTALINNVEIVVVVLVSFLSIIVLIVTSWIIIKDLTQLIVLLKVQGVSDWQNTLNILSVFFPTWFLAGIITLPILYGVLTLFQELVFKAMNIIVFAPINWWAYFLIFICVGAFLSLVLLCANRYIKKINLIESLKW